MTNVTFSLDASNLVIKDGSQNLGSFAHLEISFFCDRAQKGETHNSQLINCNTKNVTFSLQTSLPCKEGFVTELGSLANV